MTKSGAQLVLRFASRRRPDAGPAGRNRLPARSDCQEARERPSLRRSARPAFTDFLLSAAAIAGPFDQSGIQGVGAVVLAAIQATRRVVSTNTNLGIVLLLAPLAAVPEGVDLAAASRGRSRRDDRRRRLPGLSRDPARTAGRDGRSTRPGRERRSDDDAARSDVPGRRARLDRTAVRKRISRSFGRGAASHCANRCGRVNLSKRRSSRLTCIFWRVTPIRSSSRKHGLGDATEVSRRAALVLAARLADARGGQAALRRI